MKGLPLLCWKLGWAAFILFLIDYIGLFVHLFELEYERYFDLELPNSTASLTKSNNYYDFGYLETAKGKCTKGAIAPHLIVLVKSSLENERRRDTIRRTWGYERRFSDVEYRCVFLLGVNNNDHDSSIMSAVKAEAAKHGDIVQGDFRDVYFNNTLKTMLGIRWAHDYCTGSDYYMFVDDDYYVSIKNILKFIAYPELYPNTLTGLWSRRQHRHLEEQQQQQPEAAASATAERLFAGHVMQTAPLRHKFSKWYISLSEYPYDKWPPYVTAGAFVLSNQALNDLYAAGREMRAFRFDDIFLGILALRTQLTLTHCDMFYFEPPNFDGAESYRHVLASHGFDNSEHLEKVWTECRSAGYA